MKDPGISHSDLKLQNVKKRKKLVKLIYSTYFCKCISFQYISDGSFTAGFPLNSKIPPLGSPHTILNPSCNPYRHADPFIFYFLYCHNFSCNRICAVKKTSQTKIHKYSCIMFLTSVLHFQKDIRQ